MKEPYNGDRIGWPGLVGESMTGFSPVGPFRKVARDVEFAGVPATASCCRPPSPRAITRSSTIPPSPTT